MNYVNVSLRFHPPHGRSSRNLTFINVAHSSYLEMRFTQLWEILSPGEIRAHILYGLLIATLELKARLKFVENTYSICTLKS